MSATGNKVVQCPCCQTEVYELFINNHLDSGCSTHKLTRASTAPSAEPLHSPNHHVSQTPNDLSSPLRKRPRQVEVPTTPTPTTTPQRPVWLSPLLRQPSFTMEGSPSTSTSTPTPPSPYQKPPLPTSPLPLAPKSPGVPTPTVAVKPMGAGGSMATGPHQPSLARAKSNGSSQAPLAELMRPQTLDEIYGQDELVGPQGILRTLITQRGRIPSLILWGPPGTGKTTLARIMARSVQAYFRELSAVSQGLADVKKILEEAQQTTKYTRRPIVLFIDEIHRFNKAQQDFFLPFVERGTVTLIGATTENPSFKVNNALLSRTRVLVLKEICPEVMINILKRAAALKEGGTSHVPPPQETLNCIAQLSNGDARTAINTLDMALDIQTGPELTVQDVKNALQRTHLFYDRDGDEHYNIISAFHKSIRGSDANATLYWLGRMLVGGEDPLYVARRMIRIASEDVGLADPQALPIAVAAYQSAQFIGMPECDTVLAEVAVYLARAPKSVEVYAAYKRVKEAIASEGQTQQVPLHLRNAPTRLMADLGYAKDYKYNPDYEGPVQQDYLPPELLGCNFFQD